MYTQGVYMTWFDGIFEVPAASLAADRANAWLIDNL
jgi:hypothetical protein